MNSCDLRSRLGAKVLHVFSAALAQALLIRSDEEARRPLLQNRFLFGLRWSQKHGRKCTRPDSRSSKWPNSVRANSAHRITSFK